MIAGRGGWGPVRVRARSCFSASRASRASRASERNIVVHIVKARCSAGSLGCRGRRRGWCSRACRRCRLARRLLVAAAGIAAAIVMPALRAAHALAAAEHLHGMGVDFGAELFHAALVGPFEGAQTAFHIHLRAFAQVLAGGFRQTGAKDHAVPLGGFLHFTGLLVFPLVGGGDGDIGDLAATGEGTHFRVAAQVADDDDFVHGCHAALPRKLKGARTLRSLRHKPARQANARLCRNAFRGQGHLCLNPAGVALVGIGRAGGGTPALATPTAHVVSLATSSAALAETQIILSALWMKKPPPASTGAATSNWCRGARPGAGQRWRSALARWPWLSARCVPQAAGARSAPATAP